MANTYVDCRYVDFLPTSRHLLWAYQGRPKCSKKWKKINSATTNVWMLYIKGQTQHFWGKNSILQPSPKQQLVGFPKLHFFIFFWVLELCKKSCDHDVPHQRPLKIFSLLYTELGILTIDLLKRITIESKHVNRADWMGRCVLFITIITTV